MLLSELNTSARTENKGMTNRNTPQLSQMDLPIHCAAIPELSLLNTRALLNSARGWVDPGVKVRLEGLGQLKYSMTSTENEPATFRLVPRAPCYM
jgi:hypothetical protein